ncbi:hypothetical protein Cgig2_019994 [Carnegiea gigantea]|uniref:Uncharacterized protein n=1 Tax=Carnegiea gigantea TaxID=171969 RepID=A0A9Q1KDI5_9CARY|nr:hypothetical protein Cgig2_019994 [Carnegiea gigantea]
MATFFYPTLALDQCLLRHRSPSLRLKSAGTTSQNCNPDEEPPFLALLNASRHQLSTKPTNKPRQRVDRPPSIRLMPPTRATRYPCGGASEEVKGIGGKKTNKKRFLEATRDSHAPPFLAIMIGQGKSFLIDEAVEGMWGFLGPNLWVSVLWIRASSELHIKALET